MDTFYFIILLVFGVALVLFLVTCLYIFMTTGFKNTGRQTGGLFTIRGKPSNGKSYVATHLAVEALKEGSRQVYSNSPIIYFDGEKLLSSRFFEVSMIYSKNLNGSMIIHDESHTDNWSRDFKTFNKDKMAFYSRCSQHEITYYSIVQHEDRQDTVINDCTDLFCEVSKVEIPIIEIPLYFDLIWWASEEDMKNSRYHPDIEPFHCERIWFNKEIANSYNTRFFGIDKREIFEGESWIEHNKRLGIEYKGSTDFSKITIIKIAGRKLYNTYLAKYPLMAKEGYTKAWDLYMTAIGKKFDRSLEIESDQEKKDQEQKDQGADLEHGSTDNDE